MRVVGVFRELERKSQEALPSIYQARGVLAPDLSRKISNYLEHGEPVFDIMEFVVDPFDATKGIAGGSSLVTDGEWIWRSDLAYFVRNYNVSIDGRFIDHALTHDISMIDRKSVLENWKSAVAAYFEITG